MACYRPLARMFAQFQVSKNYYKTLKVLPTASYVEVKKAYHDLARVCHPDSKTGNEAVFKEVAEAFEVLGDEKLRQEYDAARESSNPRVKAARADPFASQSFQQGDFGKMDEKLRKARERQMKWEEKARQPYRPFSPTNAWSSGKHSPTGRAQYYSSREDRPTDALSQAIQWMAIGVLACLTFWAVRVTYAFMTMGSAREIAARQQQEETRAVFAQVRQSQRIDSPPQAEAAVPRLRVTRNRFSDRTEKEGS